MLATGADQVAVVVVYLKRGSRLPQRKKKAYVFFPLFWRLSHSRAKSRPRRLPSSLARVVMTLTGAARPLPPQGPPLLP